MVNKLLVALGAACLSFAPAQAATFVLRASTHDVFNGALVAFDAVLTTDEGVMAGDATTYAVLSATGSAEYFGSSPILNSSGGFTLAGRTVRAADIGLLIQGEFSEQFGIVRFTEGSPDASFIFYTEVGGPVEALEITPQVDAAVPEPATWAMLIAGFGLTGAALRRRRTGVAFA